MISEQKTEKSGNVASIINRFSKMDVQLRKSSLNQSPLRSVIACFSYSAQMEDELDLKEGDEIDLIEDIEDGWARGEIKSSKSNPLSQGKIGLFPTNFVTLNSNSSLCATHNRNTKKETARVMYKYDAANPDELSFPEGAIITVLNKNCEDDGWYEGEYNGKRGLFPENFVKLIESSTSVNDKSSFSVGSNCHSQPPSLPAKPAKNNVYNRASVLISSSQQQPIATIRESSSHNSTNCALIGAEATVTNSNTTSNTSNTGLSSKSFATLTKSMQEDRESVASLQSKLFPQGKLPYAFNKISSGVIQNHSMSSEASPTNSVIANNFADASRLSCITKERPKQLNKRPPSLNFRISKLSDDGQLSPNLMRFPIKNDTIGDTTTLRSIKPLDTFESTATVTVSKITTTFTHQLTAPPITTSSLATALNNTNNNSISSSEFVSRQEFEIYRAETNLKIKELQQKLSELLSAQK